MQQSLTNFVETHGIKAIITGTRSTDPYCQNFQFFQPADIKNGWPDSLRVMPIYQWSYKDVWDFILKNKLEYCPLYDLGYTYVGDRVNSIINPFLR